MRINCHAHVHTFASLFTEETVQVLINRLKLEDLPDFLVERIADLVIRGVKKSGDLSAEQLLQGWLKELTASAQFQAFVETLDPNEKIQFELVNSALLQEIGVLALSKVLHHLWKHLSPEDSDARKRSLSDILEFLYIGLQPSLRAVTHRLMAQQDDGGAVVALMMDITKGGDADRALFQRQLDATSQQIFAYPGRFFPFVFVNSKRKDHFAFMQKALEEQGFVGVKIYPSLGYKIDSEAMRNVWAYCEPRSIPIMQHCSQGGFFFDKSQIANCDPRHWRPILEQFPKLKICFAHFGTSVFLTDEAVPPDSWTAEILRLIDEPQFENIYTDLSYNADPMEGGTKEANYFKHLHAFLADPLRRDRILFGTDWFLVRRRLRERSYWAFFEERFSAAEMKLIAETNAARYLGLPVGPVGLSGAMPHHVQFIADHAARCEALPALWALEAVRQLDPTVTFNVNDFGSRWSRNNLAHGLLFAFLKQSQMTKKQKKKIKFDQAATLAVRELKFWSAHDPPPILERKSRDVAEQIDIAFTAPGKDARYEPGFDAAKARAALAAAFEDGDTPLMDLGLLCDQIYRFNTEIV